MKKVLATLSVVGLMVPSAAMAGSLSNGFGSEAMRDVGSSVSATTAEINQHVYREADFYFNNSNWSHNGSITAENFRGGSRGGEMDYGDSTAAGGAALGAEGYISADGGYSEGEEVDSILVKEKTIKKDPSWFKPSQKKIIRKYHPVVVAEGAGADLTVVGNGVAGGTASGTSDYNSFDGDGHEWYKDGSVAWSVGGQKNSAHGTIHETVNADTDVYSETLATSENYGYTADSYTAFSY